MFGPPGMAYVYLVYGMHECLNVVTEAPGRAAAVLIRAVDPIEGAELVRAARLARGLGRLRPGPGGDTRDGAEVRLRDRIAALDPWRLCSGPGLVTAGFDITRADTGHDLLDPAAPLRLEPRPATDPAPAIATTARVGIGYADEPWRSRPWRFLDPTSPAVSGSNRAGQPG